MRENIDAEDGGHDFHNADNDDNVNKPCQPCHGQYGVYSTYDTVHDTPISSLVTPLHEGRE